MAQCSVCGGDTKLMAGVSQKNGKPWSGNKCLDKGCGNMDFLKSNQNFSPKSQIIPAKSKISNEPEIIKLLLDIIRRQDELKALMEIKNQIFKGTKLESVKPEQEPF